MNRIASVFAAAAIVCLTVPALAQESHHAAAAKVAKTVTGELVDVGCFLGHGARGEKHVSCATKCISQGMPMGVLTSNGTLYIVTLDHDNADAFNSLKDMAGKTVSVTGQLLTHGGMKAIEASAAKVASK